MGISNKTFEDVADERDSLRAELAGVQKAYSEFIDTSKQTIEALRKRYDDAVEAVDLKDKELIQERTVSRDLRKRVEELEAANHGGIDIIYIWRTRAEQAEKYIVELEAEAKLAADERGRLNSRLKDGGMNG